MVRIRPLRSGLLLVVALALGIGAPFATPTAQAAATTTPITVTATSPSSSSLKVTWTAPTGVDVATWAIFPKDSSGRSWPTTFACKGCRSATVDGLVAGMRYDLSVVGYAATTTAVGNAAATVQVGNCSGVLGTCVSIGSTKTTAVTHVGQGLLHGTTVMSDLAKAAALNPQSWRLAAGDMTRFQKARQVGGAITVLMSDPWRGWADRNGLVGKNPWADWDKYRQFIVGTVQFHIATGNVPEYWEIQNEPDYATQYTSDQPATRALILEQLKVAHDAIRSVLPDARIVAPSLAQYRFNEPTALVDLMSVLDHAKANGLRYDLAWHEIGNSQPGTLAGDPKSIVAHVQSIRAAIADRGLTDVRIHINEYGAAWNFDQPGSRVGYLTALETAGANVAGMACWPVVKDGISYDTCFSDPGLLDGLISPLGTETDTYAVHKAYAAMTGSRLQTSATDVWTSGLSTIDSTGKLRALVGRHQSCTLAVDQGCHAGLAVAPLGKPVTLALKVPCTNRYDLQVQLIANVHNSGPAVPVTVSNTYNVRCGTTQKVLLPALTDGSAYSVVSTPR
ncbi:MAG: hypothetical protein ACJ739_01720 [Acidimicrobiales bacterium]